jgi:hypothetical protein
MSTPNIEDSILLSIKKLLGIEDAGTQFDVDLIIHINSVFSILTQLGIGPDGGFSISDAESKWSDFLSSDTEASKVEMVKSYMYMKVRQMFDPPANSFVVESFNKQIAELEWRLSVAYKPTNINVEGGDLDDD